MSADSHAAGVSGLVHTRNLYVASLPSQFTEERLRKLFEPFGVIEGLRIVPGTRPGGSNAYAFVLFKEDDSASRAIETMADFMVEGSRIQVRRARLAPCVDPNTVPPPFVPPMLYGMPSPPPPPSSGRAASAAPLPAAMMGMGMGMGGGGGTPFLPATPVSTAPPTPQLIQMQQQQQQLMPSAIPIVSLVAPQSAGQQPAQQLMAAQPQQYQTVQLLCLPASATGGHHGALPQTTVILAAPPAAALSTTPSQQVLYATPVSTMDTLCATSFGNSGSGGGSSALLGLSMAPIVGGGATELSLSMGGRTATASGGGSVGPYFIASSASAGSLGGMPTAFYPPLQQQPQQLGGSSSSHQPQFVAYSTQPGPSGGYTLAAMPQPSGGNGGGGGGGGGGAVSLFAPHQAVTYVRMQPTH